MKTFKNLYPKLCSHNNLETAFYKASKGKSFKWYVKEFEDNLTDNLLQLKKELESFTYKPEPLKKFIIRDPKTRVIRKSNFRDRIVHHAIVNILEPIYEKIFIYDSYANRKNKGTLAAIKKFDQFKRKVSGRGALVTNAKNNNMVRGYALKADIKHYFDSVNHEVLIDAILKNFHDKEKGMPLGNMTSQFFANVYLNDMDYFIKHKLKAKYYIRYVDDFVILHQDIEVLEMYKDKISKYLTNLRLELHQNKSKIFSMYKGVNLLGYRVYYHYKLLRKRNINQFNKKLKDIKEKYDAELIDYEQAIRSIKGWFAYAIWANTYKLRKNILRKMDSIFDLL
ncbi:MAG: reverse transcriptase domain-containing protein [Nanoarchaeota archaeon]